MKKLIGVAITSHNDYEKLKRTLNALSKIRNANLHVEIVDDGSTDGTFELITKNYPQFYISKGSGQLWWTGGTNVAVQKCLKKECEYVLLLNADVVIDEISLKYLLITAQEKYPAIIASVAVTSDNPKIIWWAGSVWCRLGKRIPIWTSKYIYKKGTDITFLPDKPFETSEAHGRGVLVPSMIFKKVGLFDEKKFPHYGADTDFSFRVIKYGFKIFVQPKSLVCLDIHHTGMQRLSRNVFLSLNEYFKYLFKRKNGEAIRVWWYITGNHLRFPDSLCTFLFVLALNSYRYWSKRISKMPGQ